MGSRPFFEGRDRRVAIYRADAVQFLRGLTDASIDLIVSDPAYLGMNQRLKLGSEKIIGRYKEAGKAGAKWFEESHDTEANYRAFLEQCYRVLRPNSHIYLMFDSYSLLAAAWLEAGKLLAEHSEKKLPCPSCRAGTLMVKDEPMGDNKIERWLICDTCGKNNSLLMTNPK